LAISRLHVRRHTFPTRRSSDLAQGADAVLLAVHWLRFDDVLKQAGDLSGKIVVTCSMPMNEDNTELVAAHASSGAEELAKRIPRSEEHTSELQSRGHLVCRLLP